MRFILLVVLSAIAFAEDKAVPQPIEVQRGMAEYEKNIYNARKVYDGLTNKAAMDIVTALEKAKKEYMVRGDLEGANLVAAAIKKINDGDALAATETKIKEASVANILKPTLEQIIIGKWRQPTTSETQVYNQDKTAEIIGASTASKGRWYSENGKVSVIWDRHGKCSNFNYDEKTGKVTYEGPDGRLWVLTRVK